MDGEMIYCATLFLPCILFLSYLILFKSKKTNSKSLPPSPPSLPIIGHLHLLKGPYHRALESLSKRYGPVLFLRFGQQPFVVISSPWAAEQCFTRNDIVLANRPKFLTGQHLGYDFSSVAWAPYGDNWRDQRKILTIAALSSNKIQRSSWVRQEVIGSMVRELVGRADTKVNLTHMFYQFMRDVVMMVLNGDKWDERCTDMFPLVNAMNICDFVPVLRWVGYQGLEKRVIKLHKLRDGFLQGLLDEAREGQRRKEKPPAEQDGAKKKTLVEELLHLQQSDPERYTDDILKGMISVMLTAGIDTSAKTMEWAMSLLLSHPNILEKARVEIDFHVEKDHMVKESDLSKLIYLRCIINETLRLYPVVPLLLPHFSSQECTIGGYHIPKETVFLVNSWALHRSSKVWEDPIEFRPERFIHDEGDGEGFKFMPFGAGRRACPGANLAIRTISFVLATLIQSFDWKRTELELDMAEGNVGVTMPKDKPLEVLCSPRSVMIDIISQM